MYGRGVERLCRWFWNRSRRAAVAHTAPLLLRRRRQAADVSPSRAEQRGEAQAGGAAGRAGERDETWWSSLRQKRERGAASRPQAGSTRVACGRSSTEENTAGRPSCLAASLPCCLAASLPASRSRITTSVHARTPSCPSPSRGSERPKRSSAVEPACVTTRLCHAIGEAALPRRSGPACDLPRHRPPARRPLMIARRRRKGNGRRVGGGGGGRAQRAAGG